MNKNFISTTLSLFLTFPIILFGMPLGVSDAIAGIRIPSYELRKQLEELQQTLIKHKENNDRVGEADTLNQMGAIYVQLEDYSKALELHQQALVIYQQLNDPVGENNTLTKIGDISSYLGWYFVELQDWAKVIKFNQQPLEIHQKLGDKLNEGRNLLGLAIAYDVLGQYQKALEYDQLALEIAREVRDSWAEGRVLLNIGEIHYFHLKQYSKALEYYQQALLIFREELNNSYLASYTLSLMGLVLLDLKDHSQALESLQQSLVIIKKNHHPYLESFTLYAIGKVYFKLDKNPEALEALRQSLIKSQEGNNIWVERETLFMIGTLLEKQNQPELAIVFYKEAVNVTEEIRQRIQEFPIQEQKIYTGTVAETYRRLADLLLSQGRILEAQQVLELLKVQELRNYTRNNRAGGESSGIATNPTETEILKIHGTLIALGETIEDCKEKDCNQLSQLLDRRETITQEFNQTVRTLEQEIRKRRSDDKAFLDPEKLALTSERIVSTQPKTILIYPLVLEDKIWILWASAGGITKSVEVSQVGQEELSKKVVEFRELIQNPYSDINEIKAVGKQLYNWLIPPSLQQELKANQIQNLVFSLDHVTRYIPMSAIYDGEKYLIENYTISTIISADLTDTNDRLPSGTNNTSVLALGVSESLAGFNPLPNVPEELDTIVLQDTTDEQGIYPGLELLNQNFDRKALRDNIEKEKYNILHIATHGEFVPGSAYESYLLLGDGNKLPIPDIENLGNLSKIHLVVLSACETALGDTGQDGTEIAGLSYYFLAKGAKAVMATLWSVNDKSTQVLMQQFYSNLSQSTTQSPITKAQALRNAQLSLLYDNQTVNSDENRGLGVESRTGVQKSTNNVKFSHPFYWAPFILIGNPW